VQVSHRNACQSSNIWHASDSPTRRSKREVRGGCAAVGCDGNAPGKMSKTPFFPALRATIRGAAEVREGCLFLKTRAISCKRALERPQCFCP
jgi:hypothetical protein